MTHTPRQRFRGRLTLAASLAVLLSSGCIQGEIGEPGTSCESTRSFFLTEVWGTVLSQRCVSCHAPGGTAQLRAARFQLLPGSYPDFADANLSSATAMINQSYTVDGGEVPALIAKPLGLVQHGGGSVLREGSPEHVALRSFAERVRANTSGNDACRDYGSLAAPSGIEMLDGPATIRRATLDMLGRLPTEQETTLAATEAGLTTALGAMTNDPAFYERWRVAWNDLLLTNRYVTNDGCDQRMLNLVSREDFPNRGTYGGGAMGGLDCCGRDRDNSMCGEVRTFFRDANNAIAREPVNLFDYIVRNNRPFSEILTADYTLVNPQSAHVYGVSDQVRFSSYDATELQPARIRYARYYNATRSETYDYPHAGVLTTPAFLARYPNTTTNRNRHRARVVQSFFLATDILKVGERPLDPTASEALVQAPTLNYGPCVTCHRINDPIAGAFRGFEAGGSWRWDPNDRWYTDMFPPGIAGEDMPASNYRSGLRWLAPRIVSDPRFVTSVVRFVFKGLTGREPLSHPTDTADPLYAARAAAWNEQDRIFRAIGRRFVATNMNFKTVVVEMLRSPIFRATASVSGLSQTHTGVGTAMLLTPEQLERRVRAIAGFPWARDAAHAGGWLRNEFYLPYGGINSDTIVQRLTDPSGIVVGIAERMANEIGCRIPAADFVYPAAQRRFFKRVRLDTVPESGGQPVPGSIALIRQNIADLHHIVLGERLSPDHPEVTRTYNLFVETWREALSSGSPALPPPCHARVDPWTGAQLTAAQAIQADPHGTLRGWTAVMTYLFSDFRFLYQ